MATHSIRAPYLLFLGDAHDHLAAKTAQGVAHWRPELCVGELRYPDCKTSVGLRQMSIRDGVAAGAKTMIVGVANRGGVIAERWIATLCEALDAGLDLAAGLHNKLADVPALRDRARQLGRALHDVRHPTGPLPIGTGQKRAGMRLLTVGTDCSIGKKFTALSIERELRARGIPATFRATGQTGVLIAGCGIAVDAVVSDFVAGAAEVLSPANAPDHWDVIEGQGSLFHPSYAGVSLGLLHGSQPDVLILCHEPTRTHMRGLPHQPLPDLERCIEFNLAAGRLTNPEVRCVGVAIDTSRLDATGAQRCLEMHEEQLGLPCVDPVRGSAARLVDAFCPGTRA